SGWFCHRPTHIDEFGVPDAVLDDGSHHMQHVTESLQFLYDRIASNGVYMIEDMHTAYWPEYGGGRGDPRSIIERFKGLIDDLNADHVRDGTVTPSKFTRQTIAMTAYDSILVFEKSPLINKHMRMIGNEDLRVNY
ncbi:class I SAM-dependent methyltransferase, partial [Methylorubrum populi]|nr:class I SAM-dependent methyltransferase [Methylorubrum populi]